MTESLGIETQRITELNEELNALRRQQEEEEEEKEEEEEEEEEEGEREETDASPLEEKSLREQSQLQVRV